MSNWPSIEENRDDREDWERKLRSADDAFDAAVNVPGMAKIVAPAKTLYGSLSADARGKLDSALRNPDASLPQTVRKIILADATTNLTIIDDPDLREELEKL